MSEAAPSAVARLYCRPDARGLADHWRDRFQVIEAAQPPLLDEFYLWAADDLLELRHGKRRGGVFVTLEELHRRSAQGGTLARACGVRAGTPLAVLDAMGGWGVDGLVLAARGCRVTMIERHAALSALAEDLARRSGLGGVCCRWGDGLAAIETTEAVDVIYLDPMFPARGKEALPGKRLQWLAELANPDPQPLRRWLDVAITRARQRVVLKRRRHDPEVGTPDWQIVGRTVRYDVFRGSAP